MEKAHYERVLKNGTRVSSRNFSIATLENGLGFARIGQIVAKRNVPSAVSRNTIKRRFREIFRTNKHTFGFNDVVFIAKNDSSNLPFPAVSGEILGLVDGGN